MALTGLGYDQCAYVQSVREATGPGIYYIGTPIPHRDACDGPGGRRADASSELLGLGRRAGKCVADGYRGAGAGGLHCEPPGFLGARDRGLREEGTRVSNPPSSLRGHGLNRWTPLCDEPQLRAIEPFPHVPANDRRMAKDGAPHRGLAPLPPEGILPPPPAGGGSAASPEALDSFPAVPMLPEFTSCEYRRRQ